MEYNVDDYKATNNLHNEARSIMINASNTAIDLFFRKLKDGDLNYFLDYIRASSTLADPSYIAYERTIKEWAGHANKQTETAIPMEDLHVVFRYLCPDSPAAKSVIKFGRLAAVHDHQAKQIRFGNRNLKALSVEWKATQETIDLWLTEPNVLSFAS